MAHPDDEALCCFGSLARFSSLGSEVVIIFLSDGNQGRLEVSSEVAQMINARIKLAPNINQEILENRDNISFIDSVLEHERPSLVITHPCLTGDHHEHRNLSRMVKNAVVRQGEETALWFAEPPNRNLGFEPNLYVRVTEFFDTKTAAMRVYQKVMYRWYLEDSVAKNRAIWWATQSTKSEGGKELYEAFYVVRTILQ